MDNKSEDVKTAVEIGMMAGQLTAANQAYVINTINALMFSQQASGSASAATIRQEQDKRAKNQGDNKE